MARESDIDEGAGARTRAGVVIEDLMGRRFVRARGSEPVDDGLRAILVPKFDGRILGRFLMPRLKRPNFRIRLDRFGSFVWDQMDGLATVADIAARFKAAHPEEDMADERVALFIRALAVQGHAAEVDDGPDAC